MLVPHIIYHLKDIINTFQMRVDRKWFYPRLLWHYRYKMALWKSILFKEWLITLDIFVLIACAASHFEDFLSAFKMSVDRNGFYPRLLSYYEYKMHLLDLIPFKECLITHDVIMLMPHVICHLKAIINIFQTSVDRKGFYPRSICDIEMFPRIECGSIRGQNWLISSRNPLVTHDPN